MGAFAQGITLTEKDWESFIVEDRELITGQNPASSRAIALAIVRRLSGKK